ncbi:MAG: response regulator [Bacteroidetes bacterium]|nr:MAG: response regulator [Bacteroidota bacterium]
MISMRGELNWQGRNILIVEDDQVCFSYLDVLLKPTRATIYHAVEGQQAINLCTTHPEIEVVLMDVRLPGMNGLDATRHITTFRKDLPVIAQTAYASEADQQAALSAGCCDFIAKPIRANEMLELIKKYLEKETNGN